MEQETIDNEKLKPVATLSSVDVHNISQEHKEYLIQRHGTVDLDPLPENNPADPFNWPTWKKVINLLLVAFHAAMSTFAASAIIPAYGEIAAEFHITIPQASYLTSLQIAVLGGAPLFWRPLSSRWGRRPIWLISTMLSLVFNIGCAKAPDYASTCACRALSAFFISPAAAIGSAVVTETFFKNERARWMGVWTLMVSLGVPLGSFIFGFVAFHVGWRWIYWILAIINGVQFILYIFLGPETRYIRKNTANKATHFSQEYTSFRRIDPSPLKVWDFIQPLSYVRHLNVLIPAAAYAMVFLFSSVLMTVEIPQLFGEKFHFNPQQLSLQFIGIIVGAVLGEQVGGILSDKWMTMRTRKIGQRPRPEWRLWLAYPGFALGIIGVLVFLIQTERARYWNVSPVIGTGIAAAGNQIVTTVLITYAVDCHGAQEAGSVGVFITFVRQMWGFIGPFWFPYCFEALGLVKTSGLAVGLIVLVSVIPTLALQFGGRKLQGA